MIRLLVSDIDGTLVRTDKTLSEANIAAIARARAAGLRVSLVSARPPSGMRWIAEALGLDGPIGAFNGATLFEPDGRVISAERIAAGAAARALDIIESRGAKPWLFADGKWCVHDTDTHHIAHEVKAAGIEPTVLADFGDLVRRADKIVAVDDDEARLVATEAALQAALGHDATVARSQVYYCDVMSPGGNKGDGVTALAKAYGVTLAEVAVLGDQRNDLPMFAVAALSVAMAQGPAEVRAAATHVAASNDADGVADAIDRFVLPAAR
ncbi:HAD family hydrolase [Sphingomonas sp. ASV193]|uniref:HAD family hydrolase n=1 Tax=Sphingomonas sp. ASV193 TaxID=3144405 RepID=UPI0032E92B5B